MKKILLLIILIIIVLAVGAYIFVGQSSWFKSVPQKYTGPVEKVTVGLLPVSEANASFLIAQEKGYFTANGLQAILKVYPSSLDVETALKKGEIDIGLSVDFTNVGSLFKNPTERIMARLGTVSDASFKVVTKKGSGIKTFSDLQGKKVGLLKNSAIQFLLDRNLKYIGIKPSDVILIDAPVTEVGDLLINNQADVVILPEPFATNTINAIGSDNVVTLISRSDDTVNLLVVSDQGFISAHSLLVRRLLQSLLQGDQFMKDNPTETKTILAKLTPNTKPEDKDRILQLYNYNIDLPQNLLLSMEDKARWYIENKLTDQAKVPNFLNFIYFDALQKIKPEAITIIH